MEQLLSALTTRRPYQFSLVAHYDARLDPATMCRALARLQHLQPLLGARIDRRCRPESWRTSHEPIPLRVCGADVTWRDQAAREQTDPIDVERGPLVRCVLLDVAGMRSSVMLTFAHHVADARGAVRAIQDLTTILNGGEPPIRPLPESQEDAVWAARPVPAMTAAAPARREPGADRPPELRRFDGTPPQIAAVTMSRVASAELIAAARREAVTVQACLVAAATEILWEDGTAFARVMTPLDLRSVFGLADEVATRFYVMCTGFARRRSCDFWELARAAAAAIGAERDARPLRDNVMAMAAAPPFDPDTAQRGFAGAVAADVVISNLGTLAFDDDGPIRVTGIEGPLLDAPLRGVDIVGAATTGGRLHLVDVGHRLRRDLVSRIAAALQRAAVSPGRAPRSAR
jgi:hypothetical protein